MDLDILDLANGPDENVEMKTQNLNGVENETENKKKREKKGRNSDKTETKQDENENENESENDLFPEISTNLHLDYIEEETENKEQHESITPPLNSNGLMTQMSESKVFTGEAHVVARNFLSFIKSKKINTKGEDCLDCGKKFFHKNDYAYHVLSNHIKYRPYKCKNCPNRYFHKKELHRHLQKTSHEGAVSTEPVYVEKVVKVGAISALSKKPMKIFLEPGNSTIMIVKVIDNQKEIVFNLDMENSENGLSISESHMGSDYATFLELDQKGKNQFPFPGQVISIFPTRSSSKRAIYCVISSHPTFIEGEKTHRSIPVALVGQVPVRLSVISESVECGQIVYTCKNGNVTSSISDYGQLTTIIGISKTRNYLKKDPLGIGNYVDVILSYEDNFNIAFFEKLADLNQKVFQLSQKIQMLCK